MWIGGIEPDSESEDDFFFFGQSKCGNSSKKKGKGPGAKKRTNDYFARKKRSALKYGTATSRPQDDNKDFLLYRRKINFGLMDNSLKDSEIWSNVKPVSLTQINLNYDGPIIPALENNFKFLEEQNLTEFCTVEHFILDAEDVAVDLEFNDTNSYLGMICLVQIGSRCLDLILNATQLHHFILTQIKPIFEDENKIKIVFGCDNDLINLKRDFGVVPKGFFDIQLFFQEVLKQGQLLTILKLVPRSQAAAWFYSYFGKDLKYYVGDGKTREFSQLQMQKSQQKKISYDELVKLFYPDAHFDNDAQIADFRSRATDGFNLLLQYARCDVNYLLRIHMLFKRVYQHLSACFTVAANETCTKAKAMYKRKTHPDKHAAFQSAIKDQKSSVSMDDKDLFMILHEWRDQYCKIMDENPVELIKNLDLLTLVLNKDAITSPEHISKWAKSLTIQAWAPIVFRLLKEGNYRSEIMKNMQCTNCGDLGHISFACYKPTNKEAKNRNRNEWYVDHPEEKQWQKHRRQVQLKISKKKKQIEIWENEIRELENVTPKTWNTKNKIENLRKQIREKCQLIEVAQKDLEEKRSQRSKLN